MIGVNDLAKRWDNTDAAMGERYMGRVDAAADLVMLAETAWKPVSEPPTEDDGDIRGEVVVYVEGVGIGKLTVARMAAKKMGAIWARTCDVVLMPPQGGE